MDLFCNIQDNVEDSYRSEPNKEDQLLTTPIFHQATKAVCQHLDFFSFTRVHVLKPQNLQRSKLCKCLLLLKVRPLHLVIHRLLHPMETLFAYSSLCWWAQRKRCWWWAYLSPPESQLYYLLVLFHLNRILCISTETELPLAKNRPVCFAVYSTQHCLEPHRYMSIYIS